MRKVKELSTTAQISWSPITNSIPLIAMGTHGGTLDMTFETKSTLGLYACDLTKSSPQLELLAQTEAQDRFHRLTWSSWGSNDLYPKGVIAGGSDNGLVSVWDPNAIINGQEALLTSASKHKGTISALEFNPAQQRLILASGGGDGQLLIWDLTNIKKPSIYTPGTRTYETNDYFTALSWNRQVNHILAGVLSTGRTEIWDLKQKKQVISFEDKNRQPSSKSLAWDPTTPTQLVTASDDDSSPVILVWDLRQYQYPTKVLKGHKGGIWSLNWSEQDTSLLLSSGKDNIVNCWDIRKGEIISEVEISSNLVHDAQWSPIHSSLVCTASLGKVKVHALHDPTCNVSYVDTEDLSSSEIGVTAQPTQIKPDYSKPPKWMKRPVGATFGFGGRLVSFSPPKPNSPFNVSTRTVVTEQEFLDHSRSLKNALSNKESALEFCKEKIESSQNEQDKEIWTYISAHFEEASTSIFLSKLGYGKETETTPILKQENLEQTVINEPPTTSTNNVVNNEEVPQNDDQAPPENDDENNQEEKKQNNTDDVSSLFGESGAENSFFMNPPSQIGNNQEDKNQDDSIENIIQTSPPIFTKERSEPLFENNSDESDLIVSRAIIAGRFRDAIDTCTQVGKWADALLLAQELDSLSPKNTETSLYSYTKSRYLHHRSTSTSLKIANSIGQRNIKDLVSITDIKEWKSLLAIILTNKQYSRENFLENITVLAEKLLNSGNQHAAALCYLISSNINEATKIWSYHSSVGSLQQLIEKICLFQYAIETENPNPPLIDLIRSQKLNQYSLVIASQGDIELATFFLSKVNNPQHVDTELRSLCQKYGSPVSPSVNHGNNNAPVNTNSNTNKSPFFQPPQNLNQFNNNNNNINNNFNQNQNQNRIVTPTVVTNQGSSFQKPLTFYDPKEFANKNPVQNNNTTQQFNNQPFNNQPFNNQPFVNNTQQFNNNNQPIKNQPVNPPKLNFFDPSVQPKLDTPQVSNDPLPVNNNVPVEKQQPPVQPKVISQEASQTIENLETSLNSLDLGNKKGELVKKLNPLFQNLRNSTLDEELVGQLLQLSTAIRERNHQVAEGLYKIIMKNTESWNLLGSSALAFKQLLQFIKKI